ncbi:MAG: alpha/beta hydrolase [Planctomycetaceae bacterium]|nr:alpha/beta hydrolase [Planctomycetaceae bacterium]
MTTVEIDPIGGRFERFKAFLIRGFLRRTFFRVLGPPHTATFQRRCIEWLSLFSPVPWGVVRERAMAGSVSVEITAVPTDKSSGAILYIHGGGFCVGCPVTHRTVTSHLALQSRMSVWTPDYRLAPEHPYPAALDDVECTYHEMQRAGYAAEHIVLAGDSAGAALALGLAIRLRNKNESLPGGLMLLSPVTDLDRSAEDRTSGTVNDPMVRSAWLDQILGWYSCPSGIPEHSPLKIDLTGLPPILIQVGDGELLLSDSTRLAEHAARCQIDCRLEIHRERWHVFHLQARFLPSARAALKTLASFARSVTQIPRRMKDSNIKLNEVRAEST